MKLKIPELRKLIRTYDGDKTLSQIIAEEMELKPFECPKCKGVGSEEVKYNAARADDWRDDWQYKTVECEVCRGEGYTNQKFIARPTGVEYVRE